MHDNNHSGIIHAALRMAASMTAVESVSLLIREGLNLCKSVLDSDRALLVTEQGYRGYTILQAGSDSEAQGSISTTALKLVREQGIPLLISDTISSEVLSAQESINRNDIRSILCMRLESLAALFPDTTVFLYLDSYTDRRPFSQDDLTTLTLCAELMTGLVRKSEIIAQKDAAIANLTDRVVEKQFDDLVYSSASFTKCMALIKQASPSDAPILLLGETGTGKEVLAQTIHKLSKRAGKPFCAINCGAIPATLIESQLFGHEKGAFTGAVTSRKGYFEEADTGTLFLDEIGELPLESQARLLRAVQEGEVVRVGSTKPLQVNVRIVAATNVDLEKAVEEGRFRKDLYFRLNVIAVRVPPLRERGEDAVLLAKFFLQRYATAMGKPSLRLSVAAEKAIAAFGWPGNVREIQNRMQRAVITSSSNTIDVADLDIVNQESSASLGTSLREAREELDRRYIAAALEKAPGNLTNAAKILDIDRKSLRILCEKYGIGYGGN